MGGMASGCHGLTNVEVAILKLKNEWFHECVVVYIFCIDQSGEDGVRIRS